MMQVVGCIYISVLFVYTRSSSTVYTYLTSSSETERFGFVNECLRLFAFRLLSLEISVPRVRSGRSTATLRHLPHALHFLFLHLFHHAILLSHHHRRYSHCHSLDQGENETTNQGILEGDWETTTDGEDTTGHETTHDFVQGVILLPVVDHQAIYGGKDTTPHGKGATQEGRTVPNVKESTHYSLPTRGIPCS